MSAFQELKKEIRVLEKVFHKDHERFRVKASGLDELSCKFVGKNGELFAIHCTIYVSLKFSNSRVDCLSLGFFFVVYPLNRPTLVSF